jgi:DNA helicase II / ATP-dependent DNA helicase PcrA
MKNTELNPQQLEARNSTQGPTLILAGAGTGKTRTLTQRIAYIIEQGLAFPHQILAVTFTNKAAGEMLERIQTSVDSHGIWVGTFHSLSTRIIRSHYEKLELSKDFVIIDVDDQWRLLRKVIKDLNLDEKIFSVKTISGIINRWKDIGLFPENLSSSDTNTSFLLKAKSIYTEYQHRMNLLNSVDFGDLLLLCTKLFKDYPDILSFYQEKFRYIMVDEYQDTNIIQYLWLRYLSQMHKNICAVGDEDQSIYGWRGAEIRNIMKFSHDFPDARIIRLEQNYRSTEHILSTANHLISQNKTRIGKTLWTDDKSNEKVHVINQQNGYKEIEFIAAKIKSFDQTISKDQIAILIRASFQSKIIEDVLIQQQIPYRVIGGLKFYDRLEIKNALSYIRLAYNSNDSLAFERIINVPKRGIGSTSIGQIQDYARLHQCSYFNATKMMIAENFFRGKTQQILINFINQVESWNNLWSKMECSAACKIILNESGYIQYLKEESSLESESRLENINLLIENISNFEQISSFIEHISLVADLENSENSDAIKIMTMHAAKGLEFDVVFLPGWEDGCFPSKKSLEEMNGLEEERRLAYVAITRAKKSLYILYANSRLTYGQWQYSLPSIFINEIIKLPSVQQNNSSNNNYNYSLSEHSFGKAKTTKDDSLKAGDQISHPTFGTGYILSCDGEYLNIIFNNYGNKKILKSFVVKNTY